MHIIRKAVRAKQKSPTFGLFAADLEHIGVNCWWYVTDCTEWRQLEVRVVNTKGAAYDDPQRFGEGHMVGKIIPDLGKASKFPRPFNFRC